MRWSVSWVLAAVLTAGPAVAQAPDHATAVHLLDRFTFGPGPDDLAAFERRPLPEAVGALFASNQPEPADLTAQLAGLEALHGTPASLFERCNEDHEQTPEGRKARRQAGNELMEQAVRARLLRAVYSPNQLQEVMVDFWFNHFNVFANKGPIRMWLGDYEEHAIRPYALGRFRDLLGAVAHHPAMLFYLDNWQSVGKGKKPAGKKAAGLNENYARELMELHTLGVDGGYSQQDVIELARILTGWGFQPRPQRTEGGYTFTFLPGRHDGGEKTLLGQRFPAGGGQDEGERALDLLAAHPATAHHLAWKLAQYFVSDDPPKVLVDAMATRFMETHGDIRATLIALVQQPAFMDPRLHHTKLKTPYQLVVSTARALGGHAPPPQKLAGVMRQLGQPLYGCLTPDGYKNTEGAWLSPEAMARRVTFAVDVAGGRMNQPGFPKRGLDADALAAELGQPFTPESLAAIAAAPKRLRPALMLGSPEFNRR